MDSKKYIQSHDFGYGENLKNLKKLSLRNLNDLKVYLKEIIDITFVAKIDKFKLIFDGNLSPLQIMIELI